MLMNYPLNETGKRIQNYVFNFSDFLGAGNFSKCYKGFNEITRTYFYEVIRRNRCHQNYLIELIEIQKALRTPLPINRNSQKTQSPKCTKMLLNLHQQ